MDMRLLDMGDIPQAKLLWKEAFGDSDAFIDWYFANKVLPGNSLGMFEGDLISVLHMIPFIVMVQGRCIKSAFIAGAATGKAHQGAGHMKTLLLEALALMKQRGIVMSHLYPFKHSFYENFGWATYSYANKVRVAMATEQKDMQVIETTDYYILDPLYKEMMRDFDGYIVRDERTWQWRMGELSCDGGKAVVLMKNDAPSAYMLYYGSKDKADIIETVYTDDADIAPLLNHILKRGYTKAEYFIPAAQGVQSSPHAMARVVDAKALLELFDAAYIYNKINIRDDFALWNNTRNGQEDGVDIRQLAKIVHQGVFFHADNDIRRETRDYELGNIFMPQNTCIFEAY